MKVKYIGYSNLYFTKDKEYPVYKSNDENYIINDLLTMTVLSFKNKKNFEVIK